MEASQVFLSTTYVVDIIHQMMFMSVTVTVP